MELLFGLPEETKPDRRLIDVNSFSLERMIRHCNIYRWFIFIGWSRWSSRQRLHAPAPEVLAPLSGGPPAGRPQNGPWAPGSTDGARGGVAGTRHTPARVAPRPRSGVGRPGPGLLAECQWTWPAVSKSSRTEAAEWPSGGLLSLVVLSRDVSTGLQRPVRNVRPALDLAGEARCEGAWAEASCLSSLRSVAESIARLRVDAEAARSPADAPLAVGALASAPWGSPAARAMSSAAARAGAEGPIRKRELSVLA